jgi:sodium pump decarboxylase gamma subunit
MTEILEGFKLMVVGMSIVYVFLVLLMVSIIVSARIFRVREQATVSVGSSTKKQDSSELISVISSAIAAYRAKKLK